MSERNESTGRFQSRGGSGSGSVSESEYRERQARLEAELSRAGYSVGRLTAQARARSEAGRNAVAVAAPVVVEVWIDHHARYISVDSAGELAFTDYAGLQSSAAEDRAVLVAQFGERLVAGEWKDYKVSSMKNRMEAYLEDRRRR